MQWCILSSDILLRCIIPLCGSHLPIHLHIVWFTSQMYRISLLWINVYIYICIVCIEFLFLLSWIIQAAILPHNEFKSNLYKIFQLFNIRPCKFEKWVNTTSHGQGGRHFADGIFRCIFVNEKFYILFEISLKFVPKGPIDNNPSLVR